MQKTNKTPSKLHSWSGELSVTLAISFMLCVYAPYELFFANQNEFWFKWHQIAIPAITLFLISFVLGMGLFALFRKIYVSEKNQYPMLVTALMFFFFVQGNFFISGLPPMDGTAIYWSSFIVEQIKSYGTMFLLIGIMWFEGRKLGPQRFKRFMTVSGLVMFSLLFITLSGIFLTTEKKGYDGLLVASDTDKFTMSKDKNMIVFILDSVKATAMYDAMERNPELASEFDGFTFYDDVLATHQYTTYSIPLILSGQRFSGNAEHVDYVTNAFNNSSVIAAAEENDFNVGLYIDHSYKVRDENMNRHISNFIATDKIKSDFKNLFYSTTTVMKMAGIKYAPWHLKAFCYNAQVYAMWSITPFIYDGCLLVNYDNLNFYKALFEDTPFTITDKRQMKSLYLYGAHPPFYHKSDVTLSETTTSYEDCVDACLHICAKYLRQLKAQGLYDNTAIAFVSDHGVGELVTDDITSDRQHIIFIAKGYGENGEMKISKSPISTTDFSSGFAKLLNGEKGDALFPYDANAPIVRRCYLDVGHVFNEYIIEGPAYAPTSVRKTGVVYQ